jgi:hypothetical protein
VQWNTNGNYFLDPINTWGVENKTVVKRMYINLPDTTVFSLKTKTNDLKKIPYVVKFGNSVDLTKDYNIKINEVLASGYNLIFQNDFCQLYKLK